MDTEITQKKMGEKSSLTLYRSSEKFHVTHPMQSKVVEFLPHQTTKCAQPVGFKQHVACLK